MKLLEKQELITIPYSRLLKLEHPQMAGELIGIIDKHDAEELKIKEMYDLFLAQTPNIDALKVPKGKYPFTPKIDRMRANLRLQVRSIRLRLEVVEKNDPTGEDSGVLLLKVEIPRFLEKLSKSKNESIMLQKVSQFLREIQENEALSIAISENGFVELIDTTKATLSAITRQLDERATFLSAQPKVKTGELLKEVTPAIKNLIQEISLAPLRNPGIDYGPLFSELNELFGRYKKNVNMRKSYNAKKTKGDEGDESDESGESGELDIMEDGNHQNGAKQGAMPTSYQLNVEVMPKNGIIQIKEDVTEQKKTVATSSKPLQLPHVSDDNDNVSK